MSDYVLGLDIGSNSVGWAILKGVVSGSDFAPQRLERAGVRFFEAGAMDFESGNPTSHAVDRRQARHQRRQNFRQAQRMRRVLRLLQISGLLPGDPTRPSLRDALFKSLDEKLRDRWRSVLCSEGMSPEAARVAVSVRLPYLLRARGLDERLEPFEIGRALYQLAQRRGFAKPGVSWDDEFDEEENSITHEAEELRRLMTDAGAQTLGEYFARDEITEIDGKLIRGWHTVRAEYVREFDLVWAAQARFHPDVCTPELRDALRTTIFDQRELKDSEGRVGACLVESGEQRAAVASLSGQRFRILKQINDVRILRKDGSRVALDEGQRGILLAALLATPKLSRSEAKKLLGISPREKFTADDATDKSGGDFIGNRTAYTLERLLGDIWTGAGDALQARIVTACTLKTANRAKALTLIEHLPVPKEAKAQLREIRLEQQRLSYSEKALQRLIPLMEGEWFGEYDAVCALYGPPHEQRSEPVDLLPPILCTPLSSELRNPVVTRTLTEVRKVVNAVIRNYGKPALIRIELARDLRKSNKERRETTQRNRDKERERQKMARQILQEIGRDNPPRRDIEKALLWHECGGECPYSGRSIGFRELFSTGEFQVEHIIPFSRSLDDSFANKTLCHVTENQRKNNSSPVEAYGSDGGRYQEILERVKRFQGEAAKEKLRRFMMADSADWDGFVSTQLNDTRYASKMAMQYLGFLYGGVVDGSGNRRVQAARGGITAHLRNAWGLNAVLRDGSTKPRDDHRHHAVDAVAIALTSPKAMKLLSDSAVRTAHSARLFDNTPAPWPGFLTETKAKLAQVHASPRVSRGINGKLHEETHYSRQFSQDGRDFVQIRENLSGLSGKDLPQIVDGGVRQAVEAWLAAAGLNPATVTKDQMKKQFDLGPPLLSLGNRSVPIKRVKIRKSAKVTAIGAGPRRRQVITGSNSHAELYRLPSGKWDARVVSTLEALTTFKESHQAVRKDLMPNAVFLFSLRGGDVIEVDDPDTPGKRTFWLVLSVDQNTTIKLKPLNFAGKIRMKNSDGKEIDRRIKTKPDQLRRLKAGKVQITPLGDIRNAGD